MLLSTFSPRLHMYICAFEMCEMGKSSEKMGSKRGSSSGSHNCL